MLFCLSVFRYLIQYAHIIRNGDNEGCIMCNFMHIRNNKEYTYNINRLHTLFLGIHDQISSFSIDVANKITSYSNV